MTRILRALPFPCAGSWFPTPCCCMLDPNVKNRIGNLLECDRHVPSPSISSRVGVGDGSESLSVKSMTSGCLTGFKAAFHLSSRRADRSPILNSSWFGISRSFLISLSNLGILVARMIVSDGISVFSSCFKNEDMALMSSSFSSFPRVKSPFCNLCRKNRIRSWEIVNISMYATIEVDQSYLYLAIRFSGRLWLTYGLPTSIRADFRTCLHQGCQRLLRSRINKPTVRFSKIR